MSRSSSLFRLLAAATTLLLAAACLGQSVDLTFASSSATVRQGKRVQISATIRNSGTTRVYLNQLSLSVPGAPAGIDVSGDGFGTNFEGTLEPGAEKTGALLEITAGADAPPSSLTAVVAVLGGADEEATTNLAQGQVAVTVEAEPPPDTQITSGLDEGFVSCGTATSFGYIGTDNETPVADLKYQWRLDEGAWSVPTSATKVDLKDLGQGPHKFEVAAIDGLGKIDPTPAFRNFTVDLRPLEITNPVVSEVSAEGARCAWRTNRPGTTKVEIRKLSETTPKIVEVAGRTDAHLVVLTGLDPTTDYRVKLITVDDCGNVVATAELPFRTLRTKVLLATPDVQTIALHPGVSVKRDIVLQNIADVALTGLRVSVENLPANVALDFTPPTTLAAGGSATVAMTLTAADETVLTGAPRLRVASSEGDEALLQATLQIVPRRPRLETSGSLDGSMLRNVARIVELKLTNTGDVAATNLKVSVPAAAWLHLSSPATVERIEPGASVTLSLNLTPSSTQPLGPYTGTIALNGDNAQLPLPFSFLCASTGKGSVKITATDEATYFQSPDLHVVGAHVVLKDKNTQAVVAEGDTDDKGVFTTPQVPEGAYNVEVTEAKHGPFDGTANVEAGAVAPVESFMTRNRLTYNWTVQQEPVEDHYVAIVDALFETHVPEPVLTVFPAMLDVRTLSFDTNGEAKVKYTVTNHGLIAVNNVTFNPGGSAGYAIETATRDLGTLPAESSTVVLVTVHRLSADEGLYASLGAPAPDAPALDDCDIVIETSGTYPCGSTKDADGKEVPRQVRIHVPAWLRIGDCPGPPIIVDPIGGGGGTIGVVVTEPSQSTGVPLCECFPVVNFCFDLPYPVRQAIAELIELPIEAYSYGWLQVELQFDKLQFCLDTCCVDGKFKGYKGFAAIAGKGEVTCPRLEKEIELKDFELPDFVAKLPGVGDKLIQGVKVGAKLKLAAGPKLEFGFGADYTDGCGIDCLNANLDLHLQLRASGELQSEIEISGEPYGIKDSITIEASAEAGVYAGLFYSFDKKCEELHQDYCFEGVYAEYALNLVVKVNGEEVFKGAAGPKYRYYFVCPDECAIESIKKEIEEGKLVVAGCPELEK